MKAERNRKGETEERWGGNGREDITAKVKGLALRRKHG